VAKLYAHRIHYLDPSGKFKEIDSRVVADRAGLKNAAGPAEVRFAPRADAAELVKLSSGKHRISFSLPDAAASAPVVDGSTVTYPEVFPGVDLKYLVHPEGVKEVLVLKRPTETSAPFRFRMSPGALNPKTTSSGWIELADASGEVAFRIPPAQAWDSSALTPQSSPLRPATAKLVKSSEQWFVDLAVDPGWLASAQYPVFVDPALLLAEGRGTIGTDGYISDAAPSYSYCDDQCVPTTALI